MVAVLKPDRHTHPSSAPCPTILQVLLVCGGKDAGKSTMARWALNSLLNSYEAVAYLDCDVGQSEFTVRERK